MRRGWGVTVTGVTIAAIVSIKDTISNQATSPPTLPYLRVGVWATGILNQLNTIHFVTL